jgi:hypothetical protein
MAVVSQKAVRTATAFLDSGIGSLCRYCVLQGQPGHTGSRKLPELLAVDMTLTSEILISKDFVLIGNRSIRRQESLNYQCFI